jgi:ankyrin repeat protein
MKVRLILCILPTVLFALIACSGTTYAPSEEKNFKDLKAAIREIQNQDLEGLRGIISKNKEILNSKDSKGNYMLNVAVIEGNIEIVKYLVSQGADINIKDSSGKTPLQITIHEGRVELINYFLSKDADVDMKDHFNETSLHYATDRGEIEVVKLIVSHGADLNAKNNLKETPLFVAVKNNYLDIAEYLISEGAEVNIKDNSRRSPLHEAVYQGNLELVKYLISNGAYVNAKDKYDIYALHVAAKQGQLEILKCLISKGAKINVKGAAILEWTPFYRTMGCTPLHVAANKGHLEIVKYLISQGADIDVQNNEESTALDLAKKRGHNEIISFLASQPEKAQLPETTPKVKSAPVKQPSMARADTAKKPLYPNIDFGNYTALVIGNNNYQHLPQLKTAQNDAKDVAGILKDKYGFKVKVLLDANRSDILLALNNLRWNLTKRDNLLIYYAGHGWLDREADEGYWLPVDAQKDNMLAWISNSSITASLRALKAKHVLIVADSCYSGKLARGVHIVNKTPGYLSRLSRKRARCVISSGGLEPVIDSGGDGLHSVFATAFLNALNENNNILDGAQLFNQLRRPVMLNSDQTPEYSDIRKAGHEGGEFLFVKRK